MGTMKGDGSARACCGDQKSRCERRYPRARRGCVREPCSTRTIIIFKRAVWQKYVSVAAVSQPVASVVFHI